MDAAAETYETTRKHVAGKNGAPLTEATFTQIYELISHNQSLVRSELGVLQALIQKKLLQMEGSPAQSGILYEKVDERRLRQ
jgi:hypothetical protein